MTPNAEKLLSLSFEIEGLLMLIDRRDDRTPAGVYTLLAAKADELAKGIKELSTLPQEHMTLPEERIEENPPVSSVEHISSNESVLTRNGEQSHNEEQEIAESIAYEEEADADAGVETSPVNIPEPQPADVEVARRTTKETIALTINDKFRFGRSLFDGSIENLKECVQTISTLGNIDDVKDYLINDLCMNPEDDEVVAFIELIETSFK